MFLFVLGLCSEGYTANVDGKDSQAHGWPEGKIIGLAKAAGNTLEAQGSDQEAALARLRAVHEKPGDYLGDPLMGGLARECIRRASAQLAPVDELLRSQPADYAIWGAEQIDRGALAQMDALRLPVAVAGALMPDAHVGYGLPIGGVLATEEAVIPYAVGVDIACRMRLSVYPAVAGGLVQRPERFASVRCWSRRDLARAPSGSAGSGHSTWCWTTRPGGQQSCCSRCKSRRRAAWHQRHRQPLRGVGCLHALRCPIRILGLSRANTWRCSRIAARAAWASRSPTATRRWRAVAPAAG